MSNITQKVKSIIENGQKSLEARVELIRLDTMEKTVSLFSLLATSAILGLVGVIFLVFLSITVGLILSNLTESFIAGFGIVAGFYFLLLIFLTAFRKKWVRNGIEEKLYGYFIENKIKELKDDE
jgi:hypothetical protein